MGVQIKMGTVSSLWADEKECDRDRGTRLEWQKQVLEGAAWDR